MKDCGYIVRPSRKHHRNGNTFEIGDDPDDEHHSQERAGDAPAEKRRRRRRQIQVPQLGAPHVVAGFMAEFHPVEGVAKSF